MGTPVTTDRSRRNMLLGNFYILSATIFFGINVPVTKVLIPEWMNALDVTTARLMGGCLLLWIASLFIHTTPIDRADWKRIIPGGLFLFGFLFFFSLAFRYASAIDISIIMIMPPIFVVGINALVKKAHVGWLEIVGLLVSFAGAAALILIRTGSSGSEHAGSDNLLGELIALISALCYAIYLIIIEKPSHKYPPVSLMRWMLLIASVPCLPLLPHFFHSRLVTVHAVEPVCFILYSIVFATFYAYLVTAPAIRMIGSELVSMYQYLLPIIATIAALIMKVDHLEWFQPVAMVIILVGVYLVNVAKRREARLTPHTSSSAAPDKLTER